MTSYSNSKNILHSSTEKTLINVAMKNVLLLIAIFSIHKLISIQHYSITKKLTYAKREKSTDSAS